MSELFLKIINMNISASWLVLAVLILRLVLRKAPKWSRVLLWGIVAVRLLFPFSIESALSLIPSAQTIRPQIVTEVAPTIHSGIPAINSTVNPVISQSFAPAADASVTPLQIWIPVLAVVWMIGVCGLLAYTAVTYLRLRRKIATAVLLRDNIYQSEAVVSPFVLGVFRAKVYLPFQMDGKDMEHVIAHELAHIRRRDHWWKPLGFLLLSIHWFNPLMWFSYVLLCRDIELACDEKVIRELGNEERADYSEALLNCSISRRRIAACPIAFGEVGVKARVRSVLRYRKPAFWIVLLSVVACAAVAVCFLTNPVTSVNNPWVSEYVPGEKNMIGHVDKGSFERVSDDFAIGADQYGRAVFKDPHKAFDTFLRLYADGIALIKEEFHLAPISERSTNYVPYKVYGWQATTGSPEAQEQARFVTRFLDIYETSFTEDVPKEINGNPTAAAPGQATKWFDHFMAFDEMYRAGQKDICIPEFPDVTFRCDAQRLEAVGETDSSRLFVGMPIWSVYFCDLTGDGLPELCSTVSFGSGMIDDHIVICDYANGAIYELMDRGTYDYSLRMDEAGYLCFDKSVYNSEELVSSGRLSLEDCIPADAAGLPSGKNFVAKILENHESYYIVEPLEGSTEQSGAIEVSTKLIPPEEAAKAQTGDLVEILYDGRILETYPGRLGKIYDIKILK